MSEVNKIPRVIYQFWTGDNPITENRLAGVRSLSDNSCVECKLLTKSDIEKMILPDYPIHKAYQYLNEVKQSDYLRCYFMHHFGGGYADIKHYSAENNWKECFDYMDSNKNVDVVGQKEIKSPIREWNTAEILKEVVANCYFIVRPHSDFSQMWWDLVNKKLDDKYEALKARPATCPRERSPEYALRWEELMGEIFHTVCRRFYHEGKVKNILNSGREWREYQ